MRASRARQVGLENKGLENKVVQIMESYCVQDLLLVFQNRDPETDLVTVGSAGANTGPFKLIKTTHGVF